MRKVIDVRRRIRDRFNTRLAVLGDENGAVDVAGTTDKCWVRFVEGSDATGNQVLSAPVLVNVGVGINYINAWGAAVRVGRNEYGEWEVVRNDPQWLRERSISPRVLNRVRPDTQFVSLSQLSLFRTFPVGTADQPSNRVTLYPLLHEINGEARFWRGTELEDDKPDLTPFIPATGQHRLVCVFYNLFEQRVVLYASVPKPTTTPIDFTDVEACFDQALNDDIPSGSYVVRGGQFVDSRAIAFDLRQFINMPSLLGETDEVVRPLRVWPNRVWYRPDGLVLQTQLIVAGRVVVGSPASVAGGSGSALAVRDASSSVNVSPVNALVFPNGTLTNLGGGQVQVDALGAPDTASYVLGAPDSALSNAIVIPSMRASADRIQITSGIYTHFDSTGDAADYTWEPSAPDVVNSNSTLLSHLYAESTLNGERLGLRTWSPTGAFDARVRLRVGSGALVTSLIGTAGGLLITNSDSSLRLLVELYVGRQVTTNQASAAGYTFSSSMYTLLGGSYLIGETAQYLRITRGSSNDIRYWFSSDGLVWTLCGSTTFTITVARIGFRINANHTSGAIVAADWLWTNV